MSSFKVNISLEASFTSQELADFFTALAKSEQGDSGPLVRILHPVEAPPLPQPEPVEQVPVPVPVPVAVAEAVHVPVPVPVVATLKMTRWEQSNVTLVEDALADAITQGIVTGEFISPIPSVSWLGIKHNPRSQHNQRILNSLKAAQNRTLSFTSLGAQAGIPDKEKLQSYLREMEKQGYIRVTRIRHM